jgi:DNA end-binding protein Ku
MHFASEVLEPESRKGAEQKNISAAELKMAKALNYAMTTEWEPSKYADQFQIAVMELIEAKAKKRPTAPRRLAPPKASNVVDFVAVLQESLKKAASRKKPSKTSTPKSSGVLAKPKKRSPAA